MHLFFQGEPRIGKSTCLRDAVNQFHIPCAGFTVQRVNECGQTIGYQALPVLGRALPPPDVDYRADLPGVFLLHRQTKPSVLEQVMAQVEGHALHAPCSLVVLDEIGGIELTSPRFMGPLMTVLSCGKPCIGVLKARANLLHTLSVLRLRDDYLSKHEALAAHIQENGSIHTVTAGSLDIIQRDAQAFLQI